MRRASPAPHVFVPLLSALVLGPACGGNLVGEPPVDLPNPEGEEAEGYPEGPYGGAEGDVLDNMTFAGYFLTGPSATPAHENDYQERFSLQDIRDIGGYTHMLISVAAEWCKPCREEAETLPGLYEDWGARGGYVLSIISQDRQYQTAGRTSVDVWSLQYQINYSLAHDPEGWVAANFNPSAMPVNMVIDLETMEVLRSRAGEDPDTFRYFSSLLAPQ